MTVEGNPSNKQILGEYVWEGDTFTIGGNGGPSSDTDPNYLSINKGTKVIATVVCGSLKLSYSQKSTEAHTFFALPPSTAEFGNMILPSTRRRLEAQNVINNILQDCPSEFVEGIVGMLDPYPEK